MIYQLPLYFQACKNASSTWAGINFLPEMATLVPTSGIVNALSSKIGRYRWAIWGGQTLVVMGSGLSILFDEYTPTWQWALTISILGIGQGAVIVSLRVAIQAASDVTDDADVIGTYTFLFSSGQCIGAVIAGTAFQNAIKEQTLGLGLPSEVAVNAEAFIYILPLLPLGSAEGNLCTLAYSNAFKEVFLTFTVIAALGLLSSLLIKGHSMDRKLDSEHVVRR